MRVLTISNMYPPHHFGGYELSCRDVMERFRARGHIVTVLTTTVRVPHVPDDTDANVRRELTFYWDDHVLLSPHLRRRLETERRNQAVLQRALTDTRPDVVSVWNMGAMSLGLLTTITERGIPIVFVVYDDWLVYGPNLDAWTRLFRGRDAIARLVRRLTGVPTTLPDFANAGAYCFLSDYIRRRAVNETGWKPRTSTVVYGGVDTTDFPITTPGARVWSGRLLYVGRIDERKGLHVAVDAVAKLPADTTLEIIGSGDETYAAQLRDRVARLGLGARVTFDRVPREELSERFARADVCVFPVLWDEPFGIVPLEAMACATPVIATGTGGSAEFLEDGANCLLVPRDDAGAIARSVERLAADAALRARLAEGGVRTAARFTIDHLTDELERWHIAAAGRFIEDLPEPRAARKANDATGDDGDRLPTS